MNVVRRYLWLACLLPAVASARAHPGGPSRLDRVQQSPARPKEISHDSCTYVDMDLDETRPSAELDNFFADDGSRIPDAGQRRMGRTLLLRTLRFAGGQSEAEERVLTDTNEYVTLSGAHTRCGKYFVLETRQ